MRVVYTQTAQEDLRNVYEYIAYTLEVPNAARNVTSMIMDAVQSLKTLPERNPLYRDEPWHSKGLRFMRVGNYLVFYVVSTEEEVISVVRIMYGGRDIGRQLEKTTEW